MRFAHEGHQADLRAAKLVEDEIVVLERLAGDAALQGPADRRQAILLSRGQLARTIAIELCQALAGQSARFRPALGSLRRQLPFQGGLFGATEILTVGRALSRLPHPVSRKGFRPGVEAARVFC